MAHPVALCAALAAALGLAGCAGSAAATGAPPARAAALVLEGRVVDGTGAPALEPGMVVLQGDRITCVGRAGRCRVPAGAARLEVGAGTILPGLVDLHVHARPHYLTWFLAAGVTTIRDANNAFQMVDTLRARALRPGMVWTGPMLDGPQTVMRSFGPDGVKRPHQGPLDAAWTIEVTTPEEARAAVDTAAARGAGFVKLYERLEPAVYRAAAARARERGLLVMTDLGMHSTRGLAGAEVDALEAIAAGVRSIEHASGFALAYRRMGGDPLRVPFDPVLLDTLAAALVRSGTALVPTLSVAYAFSDSVTDVTALPVADRLPAEMGKFFADGAARRTASSRERSRLGFVLTSELVRRVRDLGGIIGAGSDSPAGVYNLPGGGIHRELELLVAAGLTPLEAIHAATGAAAWILDRKDIGVLAPGRVADLVVVTGNPLTDIRASRGIQAVIQGGRVLPLDSILAAIGPAGGSR